MPISYLKITFQFKIIFFRLKVDLVEHLFFVFEVNRHVFTLFNGKFILFEF